MWERSYWAWRLLRTNNAPEDAFGVYLLFIFDVIAFSPNQIS